MIAKFVLATLAFAGEDAKSYCEPCDDETLDGILWTSRVKNNNYEPDDLNTKRNEDYGVVVKQACRPGFTGEATRLCTGTGTWDMANTKNCRSDPCPKAPSDFASYANVDNPKTQSKCASGKGLERCAVVCKNSGDVASTTLQCFGGRWTPKEVLCADPSAGSSSSGGGSTNQQSTGSRASGGNSAILEGDDGAASSSSPMMLVGVGMVALAVLLVGGYVAYSAKSKKSGDTAGSSRSQPAGGSRRGKE